MRIAFISTRGIPNDYGGFEQFAEYISVGLANRGHEVTVYSPHFHPYKENSYKGVRIKHIHIGNNVTVNTGCTFVDCNRITIGNNVLIAPNVQIYTATHPIELNERLTPVETDEGIEYIRHTYALPVTIEDGCWIGGGVIILPGITIGKGSVIGAGSVVTKNIPPDSLAAGNPCKVIRKINGSREQ